jgi:hypothetical protein
VNDEATRRIANTAQAQATAPGPRHRVGLDRAESLHLLGSVSLGRIVFTQQALPAIRPVNHVLDDGDIIIRSHEGAALVAHTTQADTPGVVVAYEATPSTPTPTSAGASWSPATPT